jgi:hypothetical protein
LIAPQDLCSQTTSHNYKALIKCLAKVGSACGLAPHFLCLVLSHTASKIKRTGLQAADLNQVAYFQVHIQKGF